MEPACTLSLAVTGFDEWVATRQSHMESVLARLLPSPRVAPRRLHEAMRYAVLGGGKRVRPLLAFAAGELAQAPVDRVAVAAAAVELIHAYSLVHDDLPCMDDDVLRRGKPTCHVEFDEATALLVGDALQSLAFDLLSGRELAPEARTQLEMVSILAAAAGSRGMAGGQAIDLDAVGETLSLPELEFMHIHKTGALIRAAALLGARCGAALESDGLARLDRFAKYIGLAFQVVDDVLDADSTTATLGKTAGKDADQHKPTYVQLLGVPGARRLALEMRATAIDALAPFGPGARRLEELADFIVMRKF
jgi:farnesyl diphosphate synthase